MEAKELMIGDWVNIKDYPMISEPKKMTKEYFVRSLVSFEPLQITEEILKLNGFTKYPSSPSITMYSLSLENDIFIAYQDGILRVCEKGSHLINIKCTYVHSLQQILRIIGLKELADNFKYDK